MTFNKIPVYVKRITFNNIPVRTEKYKALKYTGTIENIWDILNNFYDVYYRDTFDDEGYCFSKEDFTTNSYKSYTFEDFEKCFKDDLSLIYIDCNGEERYVEKGNYVTFNCYSKVINSISEKEFEETLKKYDIE